MRIEPFRIKAADADLADLGERLRRTRWPDEVDGAGWDYGASLAYLRELCCYWADGFDWRREESRLNAWPHFRAEIDGLNIHFAHVRGRGPNPLPLIVTHGWPSTFFEMSKIVPRLTDPAAHGGDAADAFDVVVPSLPGYGYSDRPRARGVTSSVVAGLWVRLMEGLGYPRFAAHGGDIGAGVTNRLGLYHADRLVAMHVTATLQPYLGPGSRELTAAERDFVALQERWRDEEGAYSHLQRTRPQTLGYGLNNSPAGLAAWIVEKFRAWSDCGGDVERRFTKDELLTNITIYWLTQTINSSVRMYFEHRRDPRPLGPNDRVRAPTGITLTREEIDRPPREWAERVYSDLRSWTEVPRGGHFLAFEEPAILADELRAFFRRFR